MLKCEQVAVLLDAFRTSELRSAEDQEVKSHLTSCAPCRAGLVELERIATSLGGGRVTAPPAVHRGVMAALGERLGSVDTALGPIWVGFNERGLTFVSLEQTQPAHALALYRARLGREATLADVPSKFEQAVKDAAEGRWSKDVPVDLEGLPSFERSVLERMRSIPPGEVRPYAWLAAEAGSPRAVRAIGNIMNRNPIPLILPCHRVVPSSGGVGNYAYGSDIKRTLLEREGVSTDSIDELARRRVRYLGSNTTHIYCYPTCRDARRIQPRHQVPFENERAASNAGYRPCKHCRPLAVAV
jgi:O-6-methylguanine DNA methyltransferase